MTLPLPPNTSDPNVPDGYPPRRRRPLLPPHQSRPAPPAAPPSPVRFPLDWLMAHARRAIRYRALTEVARLTPADAEKVSSLPFTHTSLR